MSEYDVEASDKYSLRGKVFKKLREDILNGRYQENDELRARLERLEAAVSAENK